MLSRPLWGPPVFILPFEMLLQLPEQKLHCHLVMALYSPCSHGAVRQRDHVNSKVSEPPEPLCVVFSDTPRSFFNVVNRSGSLPTDALVSAAALGIGGSLPGYDDCICVLLIFLCLCHPFVFEWLTGEGITAYRQKLGVWWRGLTWSWELHKPSTEISMWSSDFPAPTPWSSALYSPTHGCTITLRLNSSTTLQQLSFYWNIQWCGPIAGWNVMSTQECRCTVNAI